MKRIRVLRVLLPVVVLVAVLHLVFHFSVWGTGIPGFAEGGISGLAVGKSGVGEEATGVFSLSVSFSQILIVIEWVFIFMALIFVYIGGKANYKKEIVDLKSLKENKEGGRNTEIDVLYEILRERKRIGFFAIGQAFDVEEEMVRVWADTLSNGGMAMVDYPRTGDPQLVLIEPEDTSEKEEEDGD